MRNVAQSLLKRFFLRLVIRDGSNCTICGRPLHLKVTLPSSYAMATTIDHIIPRSKGGKNNIGNLRLAHNKCNKKRGAPDNLLLPQQGDVKFVERNEHGT
jgi:5-methylcytosine-specific restriction endonuclease McrA